MAIFGSRTVTTGKTATSLCNNAVTTRKYTWMSFAPVSLLFQFRSVSNVYFLLTACIMLIPGVSPINPFSAILPLCFVLLVSEIREFVEEYQKYSRDNETNATLVNRLSKTAEGTVQMEQVAWRSLHPGDLVLLNDRDKIPADLVLVASSSNNFSYVETSNLDGETNLKTKEAPSCFDGLVKPFPLETATGDLTTHFDLSELFDHKIDFEAPNPDMYRFKGTVGQDGILSAGNMMLRGCSMRNTAWAVGVCVYTGHETKAMLNSASAGVTPSKKTMIENRMNVIVLIVFGCQVLLILGSTLGSISNQDGAVAAWYMEGLSTYSGGLTALTFFVLLNTIIPMSLWVALEVLKFLQANILEADGAMRDSDRKLACQAHSKNLNEDLGQITHVFTDKTGTLTCNRMEFKGCAIQGELFSIDPAVMAQSTISDTEVVSKRPKRRDLGFAGAIPIDERLLTLITSRIGDSDSEFFKCIALCHSCERVEKQDPVTSPKTGSRRKRRSIFGWFSPEPKKKQSVGSDGGAGAVAASAGVSQVYGVMRSEADRDSLDEKLEKFLYQSTSPDEAALVSSAADIGYIFHKRLPSGVQIDINGEARLYEMLHQVAFSSERRMMSVVVRDGTGRITVYTKGADSSVIPRCIGPMGVVDHTQWAVEVFADKGLRTLCLATRELSEAEWLEFDARIKAASSDLDTRDAAIAAIDIEIESGLVLLGCTAVEDKLQAGVQETVSAMKNAGIAVCMITGDKRETAVNIAKSCKLVNSDHNVYTMSTQDNMYGGGNFIHLESLAQMVGDGRADPLWGMTNEGKSAAATTKDDSASPRVRKPSMLPLEESALNGISVAPRPHAVVGMSPLASEAGRFSHRDKFCIVLDGAALSILLSSASQTKKLLSVMAHPQCEAAVFCRVNPKQKGLIVRSCRERLATGRVLAIGDGANDISMIKEAHVGVGIFGEEGWQAAGSADYAITKFKDLYRLLFIHGRWNYMRITFFITFFMYKNFAFTFLQFWFATISEWSGASVLDDYCLLAFNSIFLTAPLFAAGLFDRDIHPDADRPSKGSMKHPPSVTDEAWYVDVIPRLYKPGQQNVLFKSKRVVAWLLLGFVHSIIFFFSVFVSWAYLSNTAIESDGYNASFTMLSQALYTGLLISLSLLHALMIRQWTWFYLALNLGFNVVIYILFVVIYDGLTSEPYGRTAAATFGSWNFWFTFGVTLTFSVFPLVILKIARRNFFPSLIDVLISKRISNRPDNQLNNIQCQKAELAAD